ncbi:HpcH/HpaI aldolase/citrate lyase family protein [Psychrobacillus soli]|uniref:HpcH/HpaI aldolase/citrate lyase family protein n=1 Tax=Psychrobacillus soli TaxID=1543965 RepID=A0A544TGH8_9BACI|nr:HpcH/HpaI aldolase/citrate lyase family protein [Psychrobacillus soli]TQR16552.1 HpcH/HpaI aldolase/citrate lyase family protein [Psychrobacillus soli]
MKHFRSVHEEEIHHFFHVPPKEFSRNLERKKLGIALGATLYIPGSMPNISLKLTNDHLKNLTNTIICLEDSIADSELIEAENNVIHELRLIEQAFENDSTTELELPLLFLRIRDIEQLQKLAEQLGSTIRLFTGIVFPKCTAANAEIFLACLQMINLHYSTHLYALPILETKEIIYTETREQELDNLYKLFKRFEDIILKIRVGATDFTSLFSLRRPGNLTVYDIKLIADCLTAILNKFTRYEDNFVISGPVYDYFKPQNHMNSTKTLSDFEAVLWKEVQLDVVNGFSGKTCVHPSQIEIVNTAYIVTKEIYDDARLIVGNKQGTNGVLRSSARNKMNEVKPHYNWALKILIQAEIYGVLKENVTSLDFLQHIKNV